MKKHYYHFTNGNKLRNGKPLPKIGEWLKVTGTLVPCTWGLHASEHPFDALNYAPGCNLHLVELGDEVLQHGGDKVVSNKRKILKSFDATKLLRSFARRCALDVLPNWPEAPAVVRQWLETGDENLREAADSAAESAANSATNSAAMSAANSAAWSAARGAAESAANSAAWAAESAANSATNSAAMSAAMSAANCVDWNARSAVVTKYRRWLKEMVDQEFASLP